MMKVVLMFFSSMLCCHMASALLQASGVKHYVRGEVFFPGLGGIRADQVCFDLAKKQYQYLQNESVVNWCLDGYANYANHYRDPDYVCTNEVQVTVPEKLFIAGTTYRQTECSSWDYSDSTRPRCVAETVVERQQIKFYTIESYYNYDTHMERPVIRKIAFAPCT